jgi:uncharacterized protein (DUF433 family)
MSLPPIDSTPLAADAQGILRVSGTRVPLDVVLHAFQAGATAEEIVLQFDTLPLADVYTVLGHYLRHRAAFDEYLRANQAADETVWREAQARQQQAGIRERLMNRRVANVPVPGG